MRASQDSGATSIFKHCHVIFLTLPFEHTEDLAMQHKMIGFAEKELDKAKASADVDEGVIKMMTLFLDMAVAHRDIIERWGRYPHRNAALGRQSTPEEVQGLEDGSIKKF